MLADGTLNSVYDPVKVDELEEQGAQISVKDKMKFPGSLYAGVAQGTGKSDR